MLHEQSTPLEMNLHKRNGQVVALDYMLDIRWQHPLRRYLSIGSALNRYPRGSVVGARNRRRKTCQAGSELQILG